MTWTPDAETAFENYKQNFANATLLVSRPNESFSF